MRLVLLVVPADVVAGEMQDGDATWGNAYFSTQLALVPASLLAADGRLGANLWRRLT